MLLGECEQVNLMVECKLLDNQQIFSVSLDLQGWVKRSVAFKFTKKQISVGRSHTRAHSRAVFLKVVFGIKCEVIHGKDYSNEVANGFRRDMFISAFLKEKTTSINSFVMWDVSIQWRDIKRDKQGIIRKIVNGGEFIKKISSIFDVWRYSADQGFEIKINKLWNAFSRVIVGRDYEPTGIIDLMGFRENIEASGFGILM